MNLLLTGLVLFLGVHLLRELQLRNKLIDQLGEKPYRLLYSVVALVGLLLVVWGKSASPFIMLYEPRYNLRGISHFAMLPAFILLVAGNLPLSHLRRAVRNPMVLGTVVWGAAHLWANGDLASVLLFGSFTGWALIKFVSLGRAKPVPAQPPSLLWDVLSFIGGFILYGLVAVYHGHLFGIGLTFA